jgi:hypothetical protein
MRTAASCSGGIDSCREWLAPDEHRVDYSEVVLFAAPPITMTNHRLIYGMRLFYVQDVNSLLHC